MRDSAIFVAGIICYVLLHPARIARGTFRIVVIPRFGGLVFKFPVVRISYCRRWTKRWFKENGHKRLKVDLQTRIDSGIGPKAGLLKGLRDNWMEFLFWVTTHHPFTQPTYFSLLGLVSIQRRGTPVEMRYPYFQVQMEQLMGSEAFDKDPHHFCEDRNFCLDGRVLRITDYGNKKTRMLIQELGMDIQLGFDPQYRIRRD